MYYFTYEKVFEYLKILRQRLWFYFVVEGRLFANGPGDGDSITVSAIPKTQRMVLDVF